MSSIAKIKVCGITRKEDAKAAVNLGVDFIGLNLYPLSPRVIAPDCISDLFMEIQNTISEGGDPTKKWVDLHHKFSYPFISVVLALMGIPLSIRSSRTGGLLFCVGVSLALGFLFSFVY